MYIGGVSTPKSTPGTPRQAVGYVRVSTADQAVNGISLEAQQATLEEEARRRGWSLEITADKGSSGSTMERPGLRQAMAQLDSGEADVLMVVRLDRLTRSVAGLGEILGRAQDKGWDVVMLSPGIDTTDAAGRFTTNILACAAQYERDLVSVRTKEALAHRKASGASLGRPRGIDDDIVARILEQRARKKSLRAIAEQLNTEGVPTAQGGAKWYASTVSAVLKMYSPAP